MATVLLAVHDLFFTAKLDALLRQAGHTPLAGGGSDALLAAAAAAPPELLIVDLDATHLDPLELLRRWQAQPATANVGVLAYTHHANAGAMRQARALGAAQVVTRAEIARQLPGLVARLTA
ncbi:MAG: hypothetical protein COW73_07400 [Nitrospirae bacterium CG18_big_fil_WC_8_21_14_2_50_70_55]|nr:hypothetical protein [Deltaproteobacteria bacterium]OIP65571.1 MAG: hypothetical protein AUK30_04310 [Nitrospirae bacterium CG2_30_70_394]PIQ04793.1 MAG: hypothetical protein COW73_07400 [Nitrospirae bacterium CG18_big_fil_WC_8_21_14_2_50_70_55]PIU77794.1 MAG: hypothetical protein COS73_08955 [Nitrospirae bacterium CG06_land_8_20_14_3_00_70_43]PIW82238.1 MAG: hypothetical protein COZ96_09940 [Nitrospirae bacterium CG_4_8_14_3_um_filter_70_85]PIX82605.1 MAG: hypothetical protein COZ33_09825 